MRVPISWLEDYLSPLPGVETLADVLTSVGLKVESIHKPSIDLENVVIGEVLSIRDHPNVDKRWIVVVTHGDNEREIVCGANNFSVGDKVPLALLGARLPIGVTIDRRTIKGQVSDGMLCSAWELGVGEDKSGILVLSPSAEVGVDIREVLGLNETVLELEITPNRPDAMSLLGVAREAAAAIRGEVRYPEVLLKESDTPIGNVARVDIEDPDGCPRYLARAILRVTSGPSPALIQKRLAASGIRPISNIVDATNYALIVMGHPMHAFDLDRLHETRIIVRRARQGEKLLMLDEVERQFDPDDLVIADADRAVALAGVMGGVNTAISEETTKVLLESAFFEPRGIFRTSKRHGLRTEASARFERGADPNGVPPAADYACSLILEWAGGDLCKASLDVNLRPVTPITVSMRAERANTILGTSMTVEEMADSLRRLEFETTGSNGTVEVLVPTRRQDITMEEDLVEEVARVAGYDNIPTTLPSGRNRLGFLTREQRIGRRTRQSLVGAGLSEAHTNTFISPADLDRVGFPEGHEARQWLTVTNPLSQDDSILRTSLLPGLMDSVERNVARRVLSVGLFEIGRCFFRSREILPDERLKLSIVMTGESKQEWQEPPREQDFFDLKGIVEMLLAEFSIDASYRGVSKPPFHSLRAADVVIGEIAVGTIGEITPTTQRRYDIPTRVLAAELELLPIIAAAKEEPVLSEPPRFPEVLLDLAVSVPDEVLSKDLIDTARTSGGELLESVRVFDVYRGSQIESGRKSVALALSFRHPERTLTEDEAQTALDAVAEAISKEHGGSIRR